VIYQFPDKINQLVNEHMASGEFSSEDELLLCALENLSQTIEEEKEELEAIRKGLASVERGEEGIPLGEAFEQIAQRHQIAKPSWNL